MEAIRAHAEIAVVSSSREGVRALAARPLLDAVLIVGTTAEGKGVDLLRQMRAGGVSSTTVIVDDSVDPANLATAFHLRAYYIVKPVTPADLTAIVRLCAAAATRLQGAALDWANRYDLSAAEVDVLLGAALGEDACTTAARRGSSPLTVKTQVTGLLRKTADVRLADAALRLLRQIGGLNR
jgi:DNA-binding NarL/FixJ family response regulator